MENEQTHAIVDVRYVETLQSIKKWKKGMCLSLLFNIRTDSCAGSEGDPHQTIRFTYQSRIENSNNSIQQLECSQLSVFPNLETVKHMKQLKWCAVFSKVFEYYNRQLHRLWRWPSPNHVFYISKSMLNSDES